MIPLTGRVLLKRPSITEKVGSIIIPERARSIPQEGTVIAVSRGEHHQCSHCGFFERKEPVVKVGEQVLHGRYSRMSVPGDEGLYLCWEGDLMAVLEEPDSTVTEEQAWDALTGVSPIALGPAP